MFLFCLIFVYFDFLTFFNIERSLILLLLILKQILSINILIIRKLTIIDFNCLETN